MSALTTRRRICAVALELFNAKGPAAISTREIAERTGISEGNLWYHFRTKSLLVKELIGDFRSALEALIARFGEPSSAIHFADLVQQLLALMWSNRFILRQNGDVLHDDPEIMALLSGLAAFGRAKTTSLVEVAVQHGFIVARPEQVARLSVNLWILLRFWIPYYCEGRSNPDQQPGLREGLAQIGALVFPHLSAEAQDMAQEIARTLPPSPAGPQPA